MDLKDINQHAEALRAKQHRLSEVEDELEATIRLLRDLPRRAEKEARFAKLTGKRSASEPVAEAEQRQRDLAEERDRLTDEVEAASQDLIGHVVSDEFTVPLSDKPRNTGDFWVFPFRGNQKYPEAMGFLADLLGLGSPIPIEGTLLDEAGVRVPIEFEMPVDDAMDRVVGAFEQVQNTLRLKQGGPTNDW